MRFPIGAHYRCPIDLDSNEGTLRYFNPYFKFLEDVVNNGQNVLVHCLAGCHRAGTSGVAWLMYKENLG